MKSQTTTAGQHLILANDTPEKSTVVIRKSVEIPMRLGNVKLGTFRGFLALSIISPDRPSMVVGLISEFHLN